MDLSTTVQTGYKYGDTITYACVTGYEITSGSATVTCQSNGRWSTIPNCKSENITHDIRILNW